MRAWFPFPPGAPPELTLAWMGRRLMRTACLAVALLVWNYAVHGRPRSEAPTATAETREISGQQPGISAPRPGISAARRGSSHSAPRSIPPQGWRRTADGWQHVDTWWRPAMEIPSLTERVLAQQNREPIWMRAILQGIREIPPFWFAAGQIVLLAGWYFVHPRKTLDHTCPAPVE